MKSNGRSPTVIGTFSLSKNDHIPTGQFNGCTFQRFS